MAYAYDNEEFSRYYDNFVAEHVPADIFWTDTVKSVYADIIEQTLVDNQKAIVVELGVGTGDNLLAFQKSLPNRNLQFIGIDHSAAMLNRAKEKLDNKVELINASLTNFAQFLQPKSIDCLLLPAGTFHHLITDNERQELINNIQQSLKPETGLFTIYLFPDPVILGEPTETTNTEERFRLVSVEKFQQNDNEWVSKPVFEFIVPPKIELSWQLRTCSIKKLIDLFILNNFEVLYFCINGKDLLTYNENNSSSFMNNPTTPVIIVFRTRKTTN